VLPPWNRSWIATEQHADEVFLLRDLTLELGHSGRGLMSLRLGLPVVALGYRTFVDAPPLHPRRFTQALRSALRYFELPIQRSQLDVAAGDRRDDRQHHSAPALLTAKQARARGLRGTAQPAPDIQLEACREIHTKIIELPPAGPRPKGGSTAQALAFRSRAAVDLWELRGAHDAVLSRGLVHVGRCNLQILVVRERRSYQIRKHGILELIPPRDVRDLASFGGAEPPRCGHIDVGAAVVGTHHAAGQDDRECQRDRTVPGTRRNQ